MIMMVKIKRLKMIIKAFSSLMMMMVISQKTARNKLLKVPRNAKISRNLQEKKILTAVMQALKAKIFSKKCSETMRILSKMCLLRIKIRLILKMKIFSQSSNGFI